MIAAVATAQRRREELERMSYGLPRVASVVIKPETPEERVARIVKEVPGVKG